MKIIIIALIGISLSAVTKFNVTNNDTTKVNTFYKNGQLKSKGLKINKFKCGYWYYYNENGKILKVEKYKQGRLVKDMEIGNIDE